MNTPEVVVHASPELLAAATAARLITQLVDVQAAKGSASVVLTGGSTGIALLEQIRVSPARDALDWSKLDVYWGDERFLPAHDPERNEAQARHALLDHVGVDPARVHPIAPADGEFGDDPEAASADYARVLAAHASQPADSPSPEFDVTLLGLGDEGHTASLFPESAAVKETERSVLAVYGSPKPPPTRISLTLPAIRRSTEVWLLTTGSAKADAVALALAGADEVGLPVAGARGRDRTLWLVDTDAARTLDRLSV